MIVRTHAVRRLKKYKLVPKTMNGNAAKNFIRRYVKNETKIVKKDLKTGALYKINPLFTAVMYGDRVVTLYPSNIQEEV